MKYKNVKKKTFRKLNLCLVSIFFILLYSHECTHFLLFRHCFSFPYGITWIRMRKFSFKNQGLKLFWLCILRIYKMQMNILVTFGFKIHLQDARHFKRSFWGNWRQIEATGYEINWKFALLWRPRTEKERNYFTS